MSSSPTIADYPEKPIEHLVPFSGGNSSGLDVELQKLLFKEISGRDLEVKFRPGGGRSVTWAELNQIPNDDHAIVGTNLPHIFLQPSRAANYKSNDLELFYLKYTPHANLVQMKGHYQSLKLSLTP